MSPPVRQSRACRVLWRSLGRGRGPDKTDRTLGVCQHARRPEDDPPDVHRAEVSRRPHRHVVKSADTIVVNATDRARRGPACGPPTPPPRTRNHDVTPAFAHEVVNRRRAVAHAMPVTRLPSPSAQGPRTSSRAAMTPSVVRPSAFAIVRWTAVRGRAGEDWAWRSVVVVQSAYTSLGWIALTPPSFLRIVSLFSQWQARSEP